MDNHRERRAGPDAIRVRNLECLLEAQTKIRKAAERRARQAREELMRVAEAVSAGAMDEIQLESWEGVGALSLREIADLMIDDLKGRLAQLDRAQIRGQSVTELLEEAQEEGERLRAELMRVRGDRDQWKERAEKAETRLAMLERMQEEGAATKPWRIARPGAPDTAAEAAAAPAPDATEDGSEAWDTSLVVPEEQLPAWMQHWLGEARKRSTRERDLTMLRVLGQTGIARRTEARDLFGEVVGIDPGAGSVDRAFRRADGRGLVDIIEARCEWSQGVAHLLRLSERGRDAYRLLFGREPAPAHTTELLKRHKSPEHVMLILATVDVLEEAGWRVDRFPNGVDLGEAGTYEPDLTALAPDGDPVYLECERKTRKKAAERQAKWDRYYTVSHGDLYIAVPNPETEEAIRSEILFWLGARRFRLRVMDVSKATTETLWAYERKQEWG